MTTTNDKLSAGIRYVRESIRLIIRFAIYMVLAPRPLERCRYIFNGLHDGMLNRSVHI